MPDHSFGLQKPRDWCEKLVREFDRLKASPTDKHDTIDHGINFAITAWHMVDWVWVLHFRDRPDDQKRLGLSLGENANATDPPWPFREATLSQCPALTYCRDICNGTKHVVLTRGGTPEALLTTASTTVTDPGFMLGSSRLGVGVLLDEPAVIHRLKIVDQDGTRLYALAEFGKVMTFWKQFLKDHGLTDT